MSKITLHIDELNLFLNEQILDDVSLRFESGKSYFIIGRNGAGKTSLFKSILGFETRYEGSIEFNTENLKREEVRKSYLPEEITIPDSITVIDYLNSLKEVFKKQGRFDKAAYEHFYQAFEIESFLNKNMGELSKGMKKKVFITIAFMISSDLMILDEPFEGLDLITKEVVIDFIDSQKKQESIVIVSSHEVALFEQRFNQLISMKKGQITSVNDNLGRTSYDQLLTLI